MENKELIYKGVIFVLRMIGFTDKEVEEGIKALPDGGSFEPKALIIQIGANALKWAREHEKN